MKTGDIVKRNGNFFVVKRSKCGHYYLALVLGGARVHSWHRTPLQKIKENYEKVGVNFEAVN